LVGRAKPPHKPKPTKELGYTTAERKEKEKHGHTTKCINHWAISG